MTIKMTITIRPASLDDLPPLAKLQVLLRVEEGQKHDPLFYMLTDHAEQEWLRWAKAQFSSGKLGIYVVDDAGTIVGYACGWIEQRSPLYKLSTVGYLSNMYLVPAYRGKGHGTKLDQAMMAWFKEHGADYAELVVQTPATATIAAWHAMGYTEVQKRMRKKIG